ncbi:site-specific integrase [Streptomyces sp. ASQP_92]|uniref:site-specific integrase n=1 Tax=Streptomyces sp. ASQP_92 TaxID=2979116 RepID=UPI0021BF3699|nr:site-specific integrase [Streptomyces sp. ASQP_92]MCT9094361.1 site-specific integrase [Streptomyces sp. ASQP_92]
MADSPTIADDFSTLRNRRVNYDPKPFVPAPATRFNTASVKAEPAPPPEKPPLPFGDLSRASVREIARVVGEEVVPMTTMPLRRSVMGIERLFGHLETLPGNTWQERWAASSFDKDHDSVPVTSEASDKYDGNTLVAGAKLAFCMRIIKPSVAGLRVNRFRQYEQLFRVLQQDPYLDSFFKATDGRTELRHVHRNRAQFDLAVALTTGGMALEDLTPSALMHYSVESRRLGVSHGAGGRTDRFAALAAWTVLHGMGHFPPDTPPTLRAAVSSNQRTIEELVDRYPIAHQGVRQMLIDYLRRRRAESDYTTVDKLSRHLASQFWAKIEQINPGQAGLALSSEVYDQWRAEIQFWDNDKDKKRKDASGILLAVRGLYMDLHSWSIQEPERWAEWVAPCPVRRRDLKGFAKRKREVNQRMAHRVRARQPLLPALVDHVESRREYFAGLLEAARDIPLGEFFTFAGASYQRANSKRDQERARHEENPAVRVVDQDGTTVDVTAAEDTAFWAWAQVEVLRHSGIRVEELVELTHLSIRQYQRSNGEVIALLVIAPSKSDRERVIPMSADLFHAIAQIIRRLTAGGRTIRQLSRYDPHEKTWSEDMPFLFQRQMGTIHGVMAPTTVLHMLARSCEELAETRAAFEGLTFTPHDFRRLFATEIINGGLPIHIGAALLGHLNLQTLQGYVAVFAEDVVTHYQRFLNHRRNLRPEGEYAEVTPEEWADFEEHFDKRKVELGNCARPYGTGCQHEHACIRCPMLQVNPKMLPRLAEIEKDLLLRRKRAEAEDWLGEIEGIDMTLTFLRTKQADAARFRRRPTVNLGMPARHLGEST